jgi:hypothetical protein
MDNVEPNLTIALIDTDDPRCEYWNTANEYPTRQKLRIESEDPKWRKSRTDKDEPILDTPTIDSVDPTHTAERIRKLPRNDSDEAKLAPPSTDMHAPSRAQLLSAKAEPKFTYPSTDTFDPKRA